MPPNWITAGKERQPVSKMNFTHAWQWLTLHKLQWCTVGCSEWCSIYSRNMRSHRGRQLFHFCRYLQLRQADTSRSLDWQLDWAGDSSRAEISLNRCFFLPSRPKLNRWMCHRIKESCFHDHARSHVYASVEYTHALKGPCSDQPWLLLSERTNGCCSTCLALHREQCWGKRKPFSFSHARMRCNFPVNLNQEMPLVGNGRRHFGTWEMKCMTLLC